MKTLLRITRSDEKNRASASEADSFIAMINPDSFKHEQRVAYNRRPTWGQAAQEAKFSAIGPDVVSFALVLDGTGAVPQGTPGAPPGEVIDQMRKLRSVVHDYQGARHEPSRVQVLWGTLIFYGRLQNLSTQYTLFKPSGDPLRAKLSLSFQGTMSHEEAARRANASSPDLDHRVLVREGDSLPLLCHRIYGSPAYYPEVARHNGLAQFRRLEPGTVLRFPPLE